MYTNVSSDTVAADEDTSILFFKYERGLVVSVTEQNSHELSCDTHYWPALFLSFFAVIGVVGNLLVCLAIATERRLQNRTNWFLLSLAVADMLVSGLVIPLAVIKEYTGCWILGPILCDLWIFLDVCSCTSSIMHIVVISTDRYLAINDPLNTRNRQQKYKIFLLIILIWSTAIFLSSPMIVLGAMDTENIILNGHCLIYNKFFVIYGSVVSFVIPLIIVIIMYTLTVRRLKQQIRQCQTQLAQEQLARAASLVAEPFLRRHIPTKNAAAIAAAAANPSPSQSTPISVSTMRRIRLRRQQTSFEVSEESVDNLSLQQQQRHQHQFDEASQFEDKLSTPRNLSQQVSTKFSPHYEYACPKNPFCQLRCTCNHHEQINDKQPLETVVEPKLSLNCLEHFRCCKSPTKTFVPQSHSFRKPRPISMPASTFPNQSSTSSNRSTTANPTVKNWRRLTITPNIGMSRTKSSAVRNEQKAVKVLGVVFVIFVLAWCPFCILNILQAVRPDTIDSKIINGFVWLGYVSSTINPLVYTIFNRNFRLKFISLLKCGCFHSSFRQRQISYYQSHSSLHGSRLQRKNGLLQSDIRRIHTSREQQE